MRKIYTEKRRNALKENNDAEYKKWVRVLYEEEETACW